MSRAIPPTGRLDAKIVLVGEAPGREEELKLKPFVGPAGQLLDRALRDANINRSLCYITNVMKVRPPNNDFSKFSEMELKLGRDTLKKELEEVQPNVIVALGERALNALTGFSGVLKYRGSILHCTLCEGLKVVVAEHPAFILPHRNPSDYHLLVFDLQRALRESLTKELPILHKEMVVNPSYEETLYHLDRAMKCPMCIVDVETDRKTKALLCVGLAYMEDSAITIPLGPTTTNWSPQEELEIWKGVQKVLTCEEIGKVGQNIGFDMTILNPYIGEIYPVMFDTMLAHHLLHIEDPHSLAHLTSIYTNHPYYKEDAKSWKPTGSALTFWEYNATDCIVTRQVKEELHKELLEEDLDKFFFGYVMPLFKILWRMEQFGVKMNLEWRKSAAKQTELEIAQLQKDINTNLGFELNVNSPKQMKDFLYTHLKLPIKRNTKTKRVTADNKALTELSLSHPHPVFEMVLDLRGKIKNLGTYLNAKVDEDQRMRTSYSVSGTDTGRLSSRKNIYNCGMDLQNVPVEQRKPFVPDEGLVLLEADLSQAENRVVAYLADDEKQIEIFERGGDFHSIMAEWLGRSRKIAKSSVHGTNYGMKKRLLSQLTGLSQSEAESVRLKYFEHCPKILHWQLGIQGQLRRNRTLTTPLGRRRMFHGLLGDDMFRKAYAFVPQSTVADWLNINMVALYYSLRWLDPQAAILLQVHDSILIQANVKRIKGISEAITKLCTRPININGHLCTIPVNFKIGYNWCDMEDITADELKVYKGVVK